MALMTMIARVVDGLPLVGTMQEDEQVSLIEFHFHWQFFPFGTFLISFNCCCCFFVFSPERVCWSIKTKPNYYSANWVCIRHPVVPSKQAHICSSKWNIFVNIPYLWEKILASSIDTLLFWTIMFFFQLFNRKWSLLFGDVW